MAQRVNGEKPMNQADRVFISYSHRGSGPGWKARMVRHLGVFERHHLLDVWQDGKIRVSSYWDDDITQAMSSARLAVVLLTPEALESQYILDKEFPFLRECQQRDRLSVFPVICEPCDWKVHDWLRATQAPNESNPLSPLTEAAQDRIFRQLATDIATELSRVAFAELPKFDQPPAPEHIYLEKFPLTRGPGLREEKLIGREQELALLDLAFAQPHTAIVSLVAWGGVGKTMLVQHWLQHLQREGWLGAQRVYAWSFYSQGTKEDRQASEDTFLAHALEWFGVQCEPTLSPWDKGRVLADAVARERTLLVLDGIEPLQYPPGPMGGQLRAPGVQSLLKHLTRNANSADQHGLCLVTTREPLADLADFQRREASPWGSVLRVDLGNLTAEAGAALLHHAGASRAGAAEIKPDDKELIAASREVDGHALTLNLLGRFLARAHVGDIRRRDLVKFEEADREEQGGTTFKMLAAFENWFANEGDIEARALTILRLLALFDRPADAGCMGALRKSPIISGLTEPLFTLRRDSNTGQMNEKPLSDKAWNDAIHFLVDFDLVTVIAFERPQIRGFNMFTAQVMRFYGPNAGVVEEFDTASAVPANGSYVLEAHPLIREHFERRLRIQSPHSYRNGHSRVFEFLKQSVPYWPEGIHNLVPLYQAVFHGCRAGEYDDAREQVFRDRILRATSGPCANYSTFSLGASDADLSALACFFEIAWTRAREAFSDQAVAWILNETAFRLRAIGRITEAVEPLRAAVEASARLSDWSNAALDAGNLSEVHLVSGDVAAAVMAADLSVQYADRAKDKPPTTNESPYWPIHMRARLAAAFFQSGKSEDARILFEQAEEGQRRAQPEFPVLYSVSGFRYCEFYLHGPERAAWSTTLPGLDFVWESADMSLTWTAQKRARQALHWLEQFGSRGLLDIALDTLTLDRSVLYRTVVDHYSAPNREIALRMLQAALPPMHHQFTLIVDAFRQCRSQEFIPLALLTRAWVRCLKGDTAGSKVDLDEAWDIAERGPMRLHMADIHLYRARLFFREKPYPWNSSQDDLAAAEKLVNDCGYHRRDEELADAKRAILGA